MVNNRIRGNVVPIMTPLTPDEMVDTTSLRRHVNYLIDNGVHGIWAAGTNGEFPALADEQRLTLIETIVNEVAGRVPVIGNISAAGTQLAVNMGQSVREMGLDGVSATPPYYFSCDQDELLAHYRYIKERVGLPLWIYNIPVTVKTVVEPATIAQLASEGSVVGIKDSSGNGELLGQLNVLCEQGGIELYRFLGTQSRITTTRAVGGHGVVAGISNLTPAIVSGAWEAGETGDMERAREYDAKLMAASRFQRLAKGGGINASAISGIKHALKVIGILDYDTVSRPLRPLTDEEKQPIPAMLKELGLMA